MPTLQKYKKVYSERIPSTGDGRRQRYPREALKVFSKLKQENLARRGRARKQSARPTRSSKVGRHTTSDLLSLQQIQKLTGISYPTLLRYVKLHLERLPHEGSGRTRRYKPAAVPVFRELRAQSPRGRRAVVPGVTGGAESRALDRRLARLERSQLTLERQIRELARLMRKPLTVTLSR